MSKGCLLTQFPSVFDDEDETDGAEPVPASNSAPPSAVVNRGASRGAVAAPPLKRRAVADFGIALKQSNPKRPGSKSHARYEVCKVGAMMRTQFRALGGFAADYTHDYRKGYVKLPSS